MRAAILEEPGKIVIREVAAPPMPGKGEIQLAVKAVGICGSDLHAYHGLSPFFKYPGTVGHEAVGEIAAVGDGVETLQAGDPVAMDPVISCGHCVACRKGRNNVCLTLKVRGAHTDGAFCDRINLPADRVHRIPPGWSWEEAALIEPFTIAAQTIYRGRISAEDRVVILGAGPIGLVILQAIKQAGAQVLICDIVDERLQRARELGADATVNLQKEEIGKTVADFTAGEGADVVIEGVGLPDLLDAAVEIASPTGRVVVLGFTPQPSRLAELQITQKELEIIGSRLHTNRFPQVIAWYSARVLEPKKLISHVFDFEEVKQALDLLTASPEKTCKVVLRL